LTYTLIIAEKPDAAARIAEALDEYGKPTKKLDKGIPYYTGKREGKNFVVCSAIGHLYTITAEDKGYNYPVFNYRWVPKYMVERSSKDKGAWIEVIQDLGRMADDYVNACDYDTEGSLIGFTLLKYALGDVTRKAKRMKYSTLTRSELIDSYDKLSDGLDFPLIEAGRTRHEVDWLYGINLSRAIMKSFYASTKRYETLSIGRIQGPTLRFLVERERDIRSFVPTPYWRIKSAVEIEGKLYEAQFEKDKVGRLDEAKKVVDACKGKEGVIDSVDVRKYSENPPTPFDIGSLQTEAYRLFGYTPSRTLSFAERLYLAALISYPRTGSQKLPPSIGYQEIMRNLGRFPEYTDLVEEILKGKLVPHDGSKTDPAHPAIYPTGNSPGRGLTPQENRIYDLIVRRFLTVFSSPARKESFKIKISCAEFSFYLTGTRILEEGWMRFYKPYIKSEDVFPPKVLEGQRVPFRKMNAEKKYSTPPPRYNPSSLLRLMEDYSIGTKATRAGIIGTLFDRGYIKEERISVTDLGFNVIETFEEFCPSILSVNLTRDLEEKMRLIEEGKIRREETISASISVLRTALEAIKSEEIQIGQRLSEANRQALLDRISVGNCPSCKTGKLLIIRSKLTRKIFVGCSNYRKEGCSFTAPLPQSGTIRALGKICPTCGYPLVLVRISKRRSWNLCINVACLSKDKWVKE
jgi:DNA topoisomerase I